MMKIAVLEDEQEPLDALLSCLDRYQKSGGEELELKVFSSAMDFISGFKAEYDLLFLDIKMPLLDGMEVAEKVREKDPYVLIVFVTNMQQYALKGYSVNAYDFIVKPVSYYAIDTLMKKVAVLVGARRNESITVRSAGGVKKIPVASILYVDVWHHKLTYHTQNGNIECWGSLAETEKLLPKGWFAYCSAGVLVHLKHVDAIEGEEVIVNGTRLKISRLRKKDFMAEFAAYLGSSV